MDTDGWMFLLALHFICVTSNDEPYNKTSCVKDPDVCEMHTLSTQLGSSVLLPCNFKPSYVTWVSWTQTPDLHLLQLTSAGRILFLNPRSGRVKAFLNQGQEGNFSISINELNNSDLGVMSVHEEMTVFKWSWFLNMVSVNKMLLIYISAGVAAFILLSVGSYCCMKCEYCPICCKNTASYNPEGAGVSPSQEETRRVPGGQQQGENEDQGPFNQQEDPRDYCNTVSGAMPHPDLTLNPVSSSGIYPNLNQFQRTEINQDEMRQQQASSTQEEKRRRGLGKKKAKESEC
ncbi:hypothetical protein F7725_020961 [Dissostichus mawsoni]|uniref:Immunoglobulin V-set domain-containing protein n=1 Tax=Dissostichus mawsoni TaxID=36200 RepID=A0A7J5YFK4_DISMA|nr:hypothetical protein F7725_020961 [Dissostichus mawsoni]